MTNVIYLKVELDQHFMRLLLVVKFQLNQRHMYIELKAKKPI